MKKVVMSVLIISVLLLLVGCLDYKAYDVPPEKPEDAENQLLDEIAQIEEELGQDEQEAEDAVKEEEIILPDLEEEPEQPDDTEADYTLTADENQQVKVNLKIVDPDRDNVSYAFGPPLNKQGVWKTNYGDAGEYVVPLTVTDGKLTTTKKIKLIIKRVNVPPVIKKIDDLFAKEGDTIRLEPDVSDPNKDKVTVAISEPLKSGTWATDHTSAGEYQVTITASDGELETKRTVRLLIRDVNVKPVISELKDLTIKEGETVTLKPTITDLDGDKIVVTISDPVGNDGIWKTSYRDHGTYPITVTANDGKDRVTTKIEITVEDVNMPPEIVDVSLN